MIAIGIEVKPSPHSLLYWIDSFFIAFLHLSLSLPSDFYFLLLKKDCLFLLPNFFWGRETLREQLEIDMRKSIQPITVSSLLQFIQGAYTHRGECLGRVCPECKKRPVQLVCWYSKTIFMLFKASSWNFSGLVRVYFHLIKEAWFLSSYYVLALWTNLETLVRLW